jgi:hypothetical protein
MGRILSGVGIPGFLGNLVKLYDAADTEGQRWRAVVEVWREAHGSKRVKAADVYRVVTGAGIDMELRGSTERAQQTAFGQALAKMKDRVIGGYQIVKEGTYKRAAEWRLMATDGGDKDPETEDMFSNETPPEHEPGEPGEPFPPQRTHTQVHACAQDPAVGPEGSPGSPGSHEHPTAVVYGNDDDGWYVCEQLPDGELMHTDGIAYPTEAAAKEAARLAWAASERSNNVRT